MNRTGIAYISNPDRGYSSRQIALCASFPVARMTRGSSRGDLTCQIVTIGRGAPRPRIVSLLWQKAKCACGSRGACRSARVECGVVYKSRTTAESCKTV